MQLFACRHFLFSHYRAVVRAILLTIIALLLTPQVEAQSNWIYYSVSKSESWAMFLDRAGVSSLDIYQIEAALPSRFRNQSPEPGQKIALLLRGGKVAALRYASSPLLSMTLERRSEGFSVEVQEQILQHSSQLFIGAIQADESLRQALYRIGAPTQSFSLISQILRGKIELRQLPEGTQFRILYEQMMIDDTPWGDGDIAAVQIATPKQQQTAIRYQLPDGVVTYLTPDGYSLQNSFMRTPLKYKYVSSPFAANRRHPILGTSRPHQGVDLAAAKGTPVKAASDGEVIWVGRKSGYGKTIKLAHADSIVTLYAHLSRYRSDLHTGMLVSKGEVIGYVGETGLATGPHLHYEFHRNGVALNPMTVPLPKNPTPQIDRDVFAITAQQALSKLRDSREVASTPSNRNPG